MPRASTVTICPSSTTGCSYERVHGLILALAPTGLILPETILITAFGRTRRASDAVEDARPSSPVASEAQESAASIFGAAFGNGAHPTPAQVKGLARWVPAVDGRSWRQTPSAPPPGSGVLATSRRNRRSGKRSEVVIQYRQRPRGSGLPGSGNELEAQPVE